MRKTFVKTAFFRVFAVSFLVPLGVGVVGCLSSPILTQILRGDIHSCIVLLGLIPNSFCLALLVCSLICFLRKWAFLVILPAMIFAFLLDFASLYAGIKYRMVISGDWILILQNTSWEELSRFFRSDFGALGALLSMSLGGDCGPLSMDGQGCMHPSEERRLGWDLLLDPVYCSENPSSGISSGVHALCWLCKRYAQCLAYE